MNNSDELIRQQMCDLIEGSNMQFRNKMKLLELMDSAFRDHLGVIFLSDKELEEQDILGRSM